MGPFEMIVAIVFIVTIGSVINHRRDRASGAEDAQDWDDEIAARDVKQLRAELKAMKDRVAVLERIATDHDKTITLDREIEALRDR